MTPDEIIKALRWLAKETEFTFAAENLNGAADLIESLQKQLIDYYHMGKVVDGQQKQNARLRKIVDKLTARAEKAEAELSTLRTPKPADSIKIDAPVQIGRVRFGAGCTVWKCPCCGTFLTPTHKYCSDCGQAVSLTTPQEGE